VIKGIIKLFKGKRRITKNEEDEEEGSKNVISALVSKSDDKNDNRIEENFTGLNNLLLGRRDTSQHLRKAKKLKKVANKKLEAFNRIINLEERKLALKAS
jgi:hypothetical protein